MMPYQSYRLWEVERKRTRPEQYAADLRRGEFAAAVYGLLRRPRARRMAAQSLPSPGTVTSPPVLSTAAGSACGCG
jgi:hypothetical protein